MEAMEPYRLSVTGIDGAGKDTVTTEALTRLSEDAGLRVAKLTRPYAEIRNGRQREIFKFSKKMIDAAHRYADGTERRTVVGGVNAGNVMLESRLLEPIVSRWQPAPDIIASTRDLRVDPAVYSGYYFPNTKAAKNEATLVERLTKLTGLSRDMIIWLQVEPEVAVERIETRMEREAYQREHQNNHRPKREKWLHMHENPDDLAELAAKYSSAIDRVKELQPQTEIIGIETTFMDQEAVTQLVYDAIARALAEKRQLVFRPAIVYR